MINEASMNCILKIVFTFGALLVSLFLNAKEIEVVKLHSFDHGSELFSIITKVVESIHCTRDSTSSRESVSHKSSVDVIYHNDKIADNLAKGGDETIDVARATERQLDDVYASLQNSPPFIFTQYIRA